MRRLALLFAGAMIWLFLAAIPTLADGGVHVAVSNSGYSTLTADTCAGCHRAHTAQGQFLIKAASAEDLCLTCHGAASTGASVDVMTGIQYTLSAGSRSSTKLGALRDGGFDQARIDSSNPARYTYLRTATDASFRATVRATSSPTDVTSSHLALAENGLTATGVAWGNGAAGSGVGATDVELECTSCHNPHGNGQYRILNTLPAVAGTGFVDPVAIPISAVSASTGRFTTTRAHGFIVGDIVTISGVTGASPSFNTAAQYVIKSIPNGVTFTVAAATTKTSADVTGATIAITTGGTGGTVQRYTALVDDAPLPAAGDERNYSILQVRGYQGTPSSYLLYASDVVGADGANSFDLVVDIVGYTSSNGRFTTGLAHGFAVGDAVTIAGTGNGSWDGNRTIATIPSATTFTLTGVSGGSNVTATTTKGAKIGTATKSVTGSFTATDGDYFHRTVPWNPQGINAACPYNVFVDSSVNPELASACTTANDAPNGRPATVTSTSTVNSITITPSAYGQIAFNDQISAWCSTCHSRYYSSTNPNPGTEPASSSPTAKTISAVAGNVITTSANHGFAVGDQVKFTGGPAPLVDGTAYYVITAPSNTTFTVSSSYDGGTFSLSSSTTGGTVILFAPASASSWWFPRPGESLYKFQHQTTTNRACTTCHVSHGSDAQMTGTYAGAFPYSDTTTSDSSRLLKIDNRGTCQMCHDPTGTATPGQLLPTSLSSPPPNP